MPGLVDLAANGRNQVDGHNLFQTYRKLDLKLNFINWEESGILSVW